MIAGLTLIPTNDNEAVKVNGLSLAIIDNPEDLTDNLAYEKENTWELGIGETTVYKEQGLVSVFSDSDCKNRICDIILRYDHETGEMKYCYYDKGAYRLFNGETLLDSTSSEGYLALFDPITKERLESANVAFTDGRSYQGSPGCKPIVFKQESGSEMRLAYSFDELIESIPEVVLEYKGSAEGKNVVFKEIDFSALNKDVSNLYVKRMQYAPTLGDPAKTYYGFKNTIFYDTKNLNRALVYAKC